MGYNSLFIVILMSFFIGALLCVQIKLNVWSPWMPRFTIGYAMREVLLLEFASSIICIILAGKVGSNIASEIGTMRVTQQIDALDVMGINSANHVLLPKILAMVSAVPLFVTFSVASGFIPIVFSSDELYGGRLLERLQSDKATRLTIKIDGSDLIPYKPLMEMLWKNGVKSHIANEEKDVDNTYMPDSRMVRVWIQGEEKPYFVRYNDFAWSCQTLDEVLYWVPMLDAHGLCLYPNADFPYAVIQQIARSAWDSHIPQVSMVLPDGNVRYCTILPEYRDLDATFPGYTVKQMEKQLLSEYNSKASDIVTINNPIVRVNMTGETILKIERSTKELRIFTTLSQGSDLWINCDANNVIMADGKTYRCREIISNAIALVLIDGFSLASCASTDEFILSNPVKPNVVGLKPALFIATLIKF